MAFNAFNVEIFVCNPPKSSRNRCSCITLFRTPNTGGDAVATEQVKVKITPGTSGTASKHLTPLLYQRRNKTTGFLHLHPLILSPTCVWVLFGWKSNFGTRQTIQSVFSASVIEKWPRMLCWGRQWRGSEKTKEAVVETRKVWFFEKESLSLC